MAWRFQRLESVLKEQLVTRAAPQLRDGLGSLIIGPLDEFSAGNRTSPTAQPFVFYCEEGPMSRNSIGHQLITAPQERRVQSHRHWSRGTDHPIATLSDVGRALLRTNPVIFRDMNSRRTSNNQASAMR